MALVLVVDVDEDYRYLVGAALSRAGHTVVVAKNGKQALEVFVATRPELVVTEIQMPVRGGLALISDIRQIGANVPIVAMTGGSLGLLQKAQELGANLGIPKGKHMAYVLRRVNELLSKG
jgi:CheY-like chemotaxis protein